MIQVCMSIWVILIRCRFRDSEINGWIHDFLHSQFCINIQNMQLISFSKTLIPHCFSRLSCEMRTRRKMPSWMMFVQCYELLEEIAHKNRWISFVAWKKDLISSFSLHWCNGGCYRFVIRRLRVWIQLSTVRALLLQEIAFINQRFFLTSLWFHRKFTDSFNSKLEPQKKDCLK